MTALTTSPRVSRWALGFATLGGGTAWFAHLVLAWMIAEWGCFAGLYRWTSWGLPSITWAIIAVSAVLLLVGLAATWIAYRTEVEIRKHGFQTNVTESTAGFIAKTALASNVLFTVIILFQTVPILFFLRSC
jgi:hypothetical protein